MLDFETPSPSWMLLVLSLASGGGRRCCPEESFRNQAQLMHRPLREDPLPQDKTEPTAGRIGNSKSPRREPAKSWRYRLLYLGLGLGLGSLD